jgi:hypothetical protein
MGGFLGGLGTLFGGFNTARRIDEEGFDFREAERAKQFARDRAEEEARQADENRGIGLTSEYLLGGGQPDDEFAQQAFGPEVDEAKRRFYTGAAVGRGAQAKSSLEGQRQTNRYYRDLFKHRSAERLVGLRGAERQDAMKLDAKLRAAQPLSPEEQRRWDEYGRRTDVMRDRPVGGGGLGVPKAVFNTETRQEEFLTPDQLRAAPPGKYSSTVTGRQQVGEETAQGSMDVLIKQADAVLNRYEGSSIFSPLEKAAAWSQYQSVIGSLGQVLGRSVLRDQRVSQQDREVYTNTIGLTSFVLAELAPDEARKRLDLLLRLRNEAAAGVPYASSTAAREAERIIETEYGSGETEQTRVGPDGQTYRKVPGGWQATDQ